MRKGRIQGRFSVYCISEIWREKQEWRKRTLQRGLAAVRLALLGTFGNGVDLNRQLGGDVRLDVGHVEGPIGLREIKTGQPLRWFRGSGVACWFQPPEGCSFCVS